MSNASGPVSPLPRANAKSATRLKRADRASSVGAGILGFGLGASVAENVAGFGISIILIGGVLHGWGMLSKHAIQKNTEMDEPAWSLFLYWGCWAALAILAGAIGWRLLL